MAPQALHTALNVITAFPLLCTHVNATRNRSRLNVGQIQITHPCERGKFFSIPVARDCFESAELLNVNTSANTSALSGIVLWW